LGAFVDASGCFWVIPHAGGGLYCSLSSGTICDMKFPCETTNFQTKIFPTAEQVKWLASGGTLASAGACPAVALKSKFNDDVTVTYFAV
jgi:hypothetical protein